MTDKELKRLSRAELLEMLLTQTKVNEQLKQELTEANARLATKELHVSQAGTLADAALALNGVFEAAQAAADQYLDNVRDTEDICRQMREDAEKEAARIVAEAQAKAAAKEAKVKAQTEKYWAEVSDKLERFYREHQGLKELLDSGKTNSNS